MEISPSLQADELISGPNDGKCAMENTDELTCNNKIVKDNFLDSSDEESPFVSRKPCVLDSSDDEEINNRTENDEPKKHANIKSILSSDDESRIDDMNQSSNFKKSSHKKCARLLDSSDEDSGVNRLNNCSGDENEEVKSSQPKNDTDSCEEEGQKLFNKKNKIKKLLDSSDESSQSDSDSNLKVEEMLQEKKSTRKKKKKDFSVLKKKKSLASENLSDEKENLKDKLGRQLFENSPQKESDNESLHELNFNNKYLEENFNPETKSKTKKRGPERKSKQNALEEIRSETQRLIRESRVSLPYHRPKQRSLADFLNRRKSIPGVPLRTPSEEMTKVWKQIEDREKEAELFYKSDSDDDCVTTTKTATEPDIEKSKDDPNQEPIKFDLNAFERTLEMPMDLEKPEVKVPETVSSGFTQNLSELDLHFSMTEELKNSETLADVESEKEKNEVEFEMNLASNKKEEDSEPKFLDLALTKVPKLSGTPDELIDLEVEKPKPGAMGLLKRFIKHASLNKKKVVNEDVTLNIVSSELDEKGEVVNIKEETVKVKSSENPKPGESLVKLKATLQQKMALLRGEQLAKKKEEFRLFEEEFYEGEKDTCDGLPKEEEEEFDVEDSEGSTSSEEEEEEEEEEISAMDEDEEEKETNMFFDTEAQETDQEDDFDDSDSDGTALISEESQEPKLPVSLNEGDVVKVQLQDKFSAPSTIDDNLLALCSGKFLSQPVNLAELENGHKSSNTLNLLQDLGTPSQVSTPEILKDSIESADDIFASFKTNNSNEISTVNDDNTDLLALCSGNFTSQSLNLVDLEKIQPQIRPNNLALSEDLVTSTTHDLGSENSDSDDDFGVSKTKKKCMKLTFSDDEDEEEVKNSESEDSDEEEELNKEEEEEFEEIEDEETELAKKLSKGFLDGEAELSGSDWDSADEDEKDLDNLEEEEGDAEKINERKLQKELGKIHMREVMAEDKREIRLLQELLLEDGDLHSDGPKRQRLFRWTNQDEAFDNLKQADEDGEADENEYNEDEAWRKERIERENFLKQKKIDNLTLVENEVTLNINKSTMKTTPKVNILPFKSPDPKSKYQLMTSRGSFLTRGEKILSKLANMTSCSDNPIANSRGGRSMVFATVSPPKEDPRNNNEAKRKGDYLGPKLAKKIKTTPSVATQKVSIFDKLKMSD